MTVETFIIPQEVQESLGLVGAVLEPLPGDASSRKYARTTHALHGPCLVLIDIPGMPHYDNFLKIGRHLQQLGFSTPRIFAAVVHEGFALIEDFGTETYTNLLAHGADEEALYSIATDTLCALHACTAAREIDVPEYDMDRLLDEVALMADWYAPATGRCLTPQERADHQSLWQAALAEVADIRETLVIRDFHVDNLMLLEDRRGVAACGLLDFQDGLIGAASYDLVSLLQDARRDIAPALEKSMLEKYFDSRPAIDRAAFMATYQVLGAQRHAKVAGIFHRLNVRDGKPAYLSHVPRVLGLLQRSLENAGLTDISAFYDNVVPQWRG